MHIGEKAVKNIALAQKAGKVRATKTAELML